MKFGAHVSIAGGIPNAPERAASLGCEVFQFFSRSPRGGNPPSVTDAVVRDFQNKLQECKQAATYIHTPYFINFASEKSRIKKGSIEIVRTELERASTLGVSAIMTHLGSAKDTSPEEAIELTALGVAESLRGYSGSAKLLLELSAGAGLVIGSSFQDMADIIFRAEKKLRKKNVIGVCLDTAHVFASGYDLRTSAAVKKTMRQFDKTIGLDRLVLIHANDSKIALGEKKDRHEHIGKGKIGRAGFAALVSHPRLKDVNMVVETPSPEGIKKDIALLKKMRDA